MKLLTKIKNRNKLFLKKTRKRKIKKNKLGGAISPINKCLEDNGKIKVIVCHGENIVGDYAECKLPKGCNVITSTTPGKIMITGYESEQKLLNYLIDIDFDLKKMYTLTKTVEDYNYENLNDESYTASTLDIIEYFNDDIENFLNYEMKSLGKKKMTPEESNDYDGYLNAGHVDFKCRMGGSKGENIKVMNNIYLDFEKINLSDLNGLLCFNEEYEKGNEPKIKDVIMDISEITDKMHMRLDEFLELFGNKGTFLFICCRVLDDDIFMDESTYEVIRNLSGLPASIDLRSMTHTNCSVCGKIINYIFDNSIEPPEECDKCQLLDESMKSKRKYLKELKIKNELTKENLDRCRIDLIQRFLKNRSLITEKKKLVKKNFKFNKIITLNEFNLNKNYSLIVDIESELRLLDETKNNTLNFERIERKIDRCHDLFSKNIKKLDKIK